MNRTRMSRSTHRKLSRLVGAVLLLCTLAGAWMTFGAPPARGVWAVQLPAPFSSPIDPSNDPPAILQLDGDAASYAAGAAPVRLDQAPVASVTDPDSPLLDEGSLTVSIVAGGVPAEDVLALASGPELTLSAGITVGSVVSVLGTPVGAITQDGTNGASLVISLSTFANPTAASLLVQAVTYANLDALTPTTGVRTMRFAVNDGAGGISAPVEAVVLVTPAEGAQRIFLPLVLNNGAPLP